MCCFWMREERRFFATACEVLWWEMGNLVSCHATFPFCHEITISQLLNLHEVCQTLFCSQGHCMRNTVVRTYLMWFDLMYTGITTHEVRLLDHEDDNDRDREKGHDWNEPRSRIGTLSKHTAFGVDVSHLDKWTMRTDPLARANYCNTSIHEWILRIAVHHHFMKHQPENLTLRQK